MAESADDPHLYWIEPQMRGIIPLETFHVSRSLAKTMRSGKFTVKVDTDFDAVIAGCAATKQGREKTWINTRIRELYGALFERGRCHTVEVYQNGVCVGGLYGIRIGGAFFGESMFHTVRDASKIALTHLVERMRAGGFTLLDTQFTTQHLKSMGAIDIPREEYHQRLESALKLSADFYAFESKGTIS